jgi:DNA-binding transcriptional regulator YhcF (GntR family)
VTRVVVVLPPIDPASPLPPFEQLRSQIASQAASGELPAGTRLPTVRQAAADLGVAVNTVARAYRELEADGVITTHGRRGTFVGSVVLSEGLDGSSLADEYAREARRRGLTLPEALALVERAWPR